MEIFRLTQAPPSFPSPAVLYCMQATESWAGPGNEVCSNISLFLFQTLKPKWNEELGFWVSTTPPTLPSSSFSHLSSPRPYPSLSLPFFSLPFFSLPYSPSLTRPPFLLPPFLLPPLLSLPYSPSLTLSPFLLSPFLLSPFLLPPVLFI